MKLVHERRRDDMSWIFDWLVKQTGRVQNFAYEERDVPPEVKSYNMIPKHLGKQGMHQETIARAAEKAGHLDTALDSYWRAVVSYVNAQHCVYYDDHPEKIRLYGRLRECYDRVIALSDHPMELVEVPWEGKEIQCVLHLTPSREKAPTILFIPGMDMTKERFPDSRVNHAVRRGMNMMVMDGPGQGMSNMRKIRVTHDNYERAASAVIDYLLTRPEVDPDRIAVCGASMGSFWGVRTCAHDHRVKALATAASCLDGKTAIFEQASPRFKRVFMYMAGIHDEDQFDKEVAEHMTTVGYGGKVRCPTLIVQGEYDPLSPLEDAEELFEELQVPKEMWILEDDFHGLKGIRGFGGSDVYPFMMDWVKDVLNKGLPATHKSVKWLEPKNGAGPYDEG
ncbi:MAG: alpha/beta hydrolase [Dehalococcoidia bacterium]